MKYTCWAIPNLDKSTNWTFTLLWINSADSNCLMSPDSGLQLTLVCTKSREQWSLWGLTNRPGAWHEQYRDKLNPVCHMSLRKKNTHNVHCLLTIDGKLEKVASKREKPWNATCTIFPSSRCTGLFAKILVASFSKTGSPLLVTMVLT